MSFQCHFNFISIQFQFNFNFNLISISISFQFHLNFISISSQFHFNSIKYIPFHRFIIDHILRFYFKSNSISLQFDFSSFSISVSFQFQFLFNFISVPLYVHRFQFHGSYSSIPFQFYSRSILFIWSVLLIEFKPGERSTGSWSKEKDPPEVVTQLRGMWMWFQLPMQCKLQLSNVDLLWTLHTVSLERQYI